MRTPYVAERHFERPDAPPENFYRPPPQPDVIDAYPPPQALAPWRPPRLGDILVDFVLRVFETMLAAGFQEAAWFWGERRRFHPPGYRKEWDYYER